MTKQYGPIVKDLKDGNVKLSTPHLHDLLANQIKDLQETFNILAEKDNPTEHIQREYSPKYLAAYAERLYNSRRRRALYLRNDLLGEPAWDLLLDLYVQHCAGKRVSVTSACIAAAVPPTTALRWISVLERDLLICRQSDEADGRRHHLCFTSKGLTMIESMLADVIDQLR